MADERDSLLCCNCDIGAHAFRDHWHVYVKGKSGSVGGKCLVAGCRCRGFIVFALDKDSNVAEESLKGLC